MMQPSRIEALETENDLLRAQIVQLECALGADQTAPAVFQFSGSEARVFGVLMRRGVATRDMIMLALYGGRPDSDVGVDIIMVFICHIRAKVKRFGIEIDTVKRYGYRLTPEMKAKVRGLMQQEGMSA